MPDDKSLTIDTSDLRRGLARLAAAVPKARSKALRKVALDVLAEAVQNAPIDLGALRASGGVTTQGFEKAPPGSHTGTTRAGASETRAIPRFPRKAGEDEAIIYFTMEYAASVHEDLEATHAQGGAKFLENAIRRQAKELAKVAGQALMSEARG